MADQKVFVRRGSRFYSWLEAKPLELRLPALLESIINPMQEQEMSRTTITSILRQLSMDCYVSLTPLPQKLVQQFTARTTHRSRSSGINEGVITISSDESDDESCKPFLMGSKRRAINRILSDDDDDDDVQVIEEESPPSSVLQTEIQVSIKVCGSGNIQPKLFDLEKQEVIPLSLPEHSNKYSSSSNENDTLSDDVIFEKLSKRKHAKYITCFSEDGNEAPKLKIRKLSDNTKKKASLDSEDVSSETSDNLGSVNPVLNNKKVRRSTNDSKRHCENYSETRPLDECTSKMYPQKNKKQSSHKNERRKEKSKIRPDVEEEEEPKKRKIHKRRKSSTKENRRNSKSISSATTDNGSSVSSVINHTVDQLWSSFGMESPYERSGNIIKSFPGTTTITSSNNNDTEVQQKHNSNSTIDKSKIDCLTNEVVSAIRNTKTTVTNIETANQTSSTTFSSPNQNIVESFVATPSNQIISSDKLCETVTSNIGKIRLRDPKTLMKSSDDIPDPVPLNSFPISEASRSTENNEANSVDKPLIPGSITDEQPSMTIHHLPLNQGNEQLSSETNQNQANIVEGNTELDNEANTTLIRYYKWYYQQDVEVKCATMSEILHLVIAAKICRDGRLNGATKLTSKNSIAEEKRRVEREYSDTLRVRGREFKVLFSDVIESELVLPRQVLIIGIYCKIISGLLRIEETNSEFDLSARSLICEMLKKNGYKNQLVYEMYSLSDDHFKSKYRKMQYVISILYQEKPQEMLNNTVLSSERANISSTEKSVNAGYIINLGFDIQKYLEQHILPQEKASRIPEQQGTAHLGAPTISGIEVNHNSVIKHVSSKNNPNISNVDIEYATTNPNLANQSPSTLPISSVSRSTIQEYQQISRTPPAYHGVHQIVQNNHNVARVNPNVSAPHVSPGFGRIENENHNYNIQQQALNGQMYQEQGKRVSPVNTQTQLAQQTQDVPKTQDRINYYSHFSKEYQQTVQVQNGYKMLTPQQLQNGRFLNTQQNGNSEKLAMNPPQYSQMQNIYRRLSSEHQEAEKRKSWQPPMYNTQAGQIHRTHQTSESIYSVNDQNVKKPTATDSQVTLALRTSEQNNLRQITKPPENRNSYSVAQASSPEHNNYRQVTKPSEIRNSYSLVQASSPEHNNHRQVTKPSEIRNSYSLVQASSPEHNNHRQVTKPSEIRNSYSLVQSSSPEHNNHRQVTKPSEIRNSYSLVQASSPEHNNHRQVTKPSEIRNSYSLVQASSPEHNNDRQVTKPSEIRNSYSLVQASSPEHNNDRQVTKPSEIRNSYSLVQASSPEHNNDRQVTKPSEVRNSYSLVQASSPEHNNHRQVTKPSEIINSYSLVQASSPEHNNHRQVTKPSEIRNSYSLVQASSPEHNNHRQVTKPSEIRNSYSLVQASSPEHNNHRQVTKPSEIRNSYSLVQASSPEHNNHRQVTNPPENGINNPLAQASSPEKNNHSQVTKTPEIRNSNTAVQVNSTNSNSRTNQLNRSQANIESEVNNCLKDNPHAISYARLRQTSAIQNHREVKRALVHPMVNKLVQKFNLPERPFTVAPSTNRNIPISPVLHNGYTNLYQPPLDRRNPVQSLHNTSVETNQKEKERLSDKFLKNQQTFNTVHGQPNCNQTGQPDKTHLGAFQNVSRNSPAYTSAPNQIPEQYFGHPAQYISHMNTLDNATTPQLNRNQAIHQNNVSQYQQGNLSNTIPPLQRNDKAINSQSHGMTQQNSSDNRNKTLFSLLTKSVNSAETNVAKQNQNSSINTVSPNLQNSVTSGNSKSYEQSILKQPNNGPNKSIHQLQDTNVTVSEFIKAKTALFEAELRYSDKNVPLQNASDKSLAMYCQAKAQLLVQNNIHNVPNQKDQPCGNSTLNQHQMPSKPRTEINITNILGSSVSASLNEEKQVNAISQHNVHSPISSTRKPMDQSDQTSKIQIHSVHSQSPSVFYRNQEGSTNKQRNPCSNVKCHNEANVLCSGCQNACYCSKDCQVDHWYMGHHEVCST